MVVVNTNIVVHPMLEGNATHGARALLAADSGWHSEPFLLVKFTNVVATAGPAASQLPPPGRHCPTRRAAPRLTQSLDQALRV